MNDRVFLDIWGRARQIYYSLLFIIYIFIGIILLFINIHVEGTEITFSILESTFIYTIILSFSSGITLALIRNSILLRFKKNIWITETRELFIKRYLYLMLILFLISMLLSLANIIDFSSALRWLSPASFLSIFLPFLNFYTHFGKIRFYFQQAKIYGTPYWIKKGSKELEKYLENRDIAVSSYDVTYHLYMKRIKNEDITTLIQRLIDSLSSSDENSSLYRVLEEIFGDDRLIKKVERFTWKEIPESLIIKPELLQSLITLILFVSIIIFFILTGRIVVA